MYRSTYQLNYLVQSPHEILSIYWLDGEGYSGSTECEAQIVQHEINALELAGYIVVDVSKS